jgi:hypothetical protein
MKRATLFKSERKGKARRVNPPNFFRKKDIKSIVYFKRKILPME